MPVAWFEVTGKSGQRLRTFYGDLFGWKAADVAPGADYGVTEAASRGIGGGLGADPTGNGGHLTFFVEVPDFEAALREVERLGGKRVGNPTAFPDKRPSSKGRGKVAFAYFTDPEGHLVGLCQGIIRRKAI
ncbi:MAG TPA: VOC family protein [Thermoplasmata archaeon]|nr:VOC family protein [Thermoplasmata archaeon]